MMQKLSSYEAHVTMEPPHRETAHLMRSTWESLAQQHSGWKTSVIDGDPILGKKVFFYFTAYDSDPHNLLLRMRALATDVEAKTGVRPIRLKIEHIVYDTKTSVDELHTLLTKVDDKKPLRRACELLLFLHEHEHVSAVDGSGAIVSAALDAVRTEILTDE